MASNLGQQFTETAKLIRDVIPSGSRTALEEKKLLFDIGQQQERTAMERQRLGMAQEQHGMTMAKLRDEESIRQDQMAEIQRQKDTAFHLPTSEIMKKASFSQREWVSTKLHQLQNIFGPDAKYNHKSGNIEVVDPETNQLRAISEYEFNLKAPQIATALGMVTDGMKILRDAAERNHAGAKAKLKEIAMGGDEALLKYYQGMLATKHMMFSRLMGSGQIPASYVKLAKEGIAHTAGKIQTIQDRMKTASTEKQKQAFEIKKINLQAQHDAIGKLQAGLMKQRAALAKEILDANVRLTTGIYEGKDEKRGEYIINTYSLQERFNLDPNSISEDDRALLLIGRGRQKRDQELINQLNERIKLLDGQFMELAGKRKVLEGGVKGVDTQLGGKPAPEALTFGAPEAVSPMEMAPTAGYQEMAGDLKGKKVVKRIYPDGEEIWDTEGKLIATSRGKDKEKPTAALPTPKANVTVKEFLGLETKYMGPERVKKVEEILRKKEGKGISLDMKINEDIVREIKKAMKEAGIAVSFINDWLKSMWYSADEATKQVLKKVGDIEIPGLKK